MGWSVIFQTELRDLLQCGFRVVDLVDQAICMPIKTRSYSLCHLVRSNRLPNAFENNTRYCDGSRGLCGGCALADNNDRGVIGLITSLAVLRTKHLRNRFGCNDEVGSWRARTIGAGLHAKPIGAQAVKRFHSQLRSTLTLQTLYKKFLLLVEPLKADPHFLCAFAHCPQMSFFFLLRPRGAE